jgi:large subunit ribosomal protein L17
MKKRKKGVKLSRGQAARKALFRSLIRALVEHGSVETTDAKAKALESKVARLVNIAKTGSVNSRRRVYSYLGNDRETTDKIFRLSKEFGFSQKLTGGFTRIVKLPVRRGDGARLVRMEWVKKKVEKDNKKGKKAEEKKTDSKKSKSKKK